MPRCKTCGSNFTEKSRSEFEAAPAWKDECPACTKKKFETYLSGYLVKIIRLEGLVTIARRYFGEAALHVGEGDPEERVIAAVTDLVYSRHGMQRATAPATPGHSIADFVTFSDAAIKEITKPDRKARVHVAVLMAGAACIVVIGLLLYFFA
ncbi:MAG: hypothetical protein GYA24_21495 [Candidatus Lokiarchaeota archaeon]|nr:hypothetical protein [Candidatus Lokiarchaeota archaeon]